MSDFKVQRGTAVIAGNSTSVTLTAGTDYDPPVSASKAFIRSVALNAFTSGVQGSDFDGQITRNTVTIGTAAPITTSVTFTRPQTASGALSIDWEIIEYVGPDGGANEMRVLGVGTVTTTSTGLTVNTPSVTHTNAADVAVFITAQSSQHSNGRGTLGAALFTGEYDSGASRAVFTRGASSNGSGDAPGSVSYAIVEFSGAHWAVERAVATRTTAGAAPVAITDVGSVARAFLHIQQRNTEATVASNLQTELGVEAHLSATNAVTIDLAQCTGTRTVVAWIVRSSQTTGTVMTVQRHNGTQADDQEADATGFTDAVAAVASLSTASIMGECANVGTGPASDTHLSMLSFRLNTASQVRMLRGRNANSRLWRYEVVEWPTAQSVPSASLVIDTQPSNSWDGQTIRPAVVVRATTDGSTTDTAFTGNVIATRQTGTGTLGGTTTLAAVAGVATFSNLAITGSGVHTLRFTANSLTVDSTSFNVATGTGVPGGGNLAYTEADMQQDVRALGAASQVGEVLILNTDGTPATGLANNTAGLACNASTDGGAASPVTLAAMTLGGAYVSGGFVQINATTRPGWYAFGYPTFPSSGQRRSFTFTGTGLRPATVRVTMTAYDPTADNTQAVANAVVEAELNTLETYNRSSNTSASITGPAGARTLTIVTDPTYQPIESIS